MAREASVAPKERVNITYRPATGDQTSEVELPLHLLVLGDFSGKPDERPLEEREPIAIDKDNFDAVLAEHGVAVDISVPNVLSEDGKGELAVKLAFKKMSDFAPDSIVQQIPAAKKLLELREALVALKGPMGNNAAFRRALESIVRDEGARTQLIAELGASQVEEDAP